MDINGIVEGQVRKLLHLGVISHEAQEHIVETYVKRRWESAIQELEATLFEEFKASLEKGTLVHVPPSAEDLDAVADEQKAAEATTDGAQS